MQNDAVWDVHNIPVRLLNRLLDRTIVSWEAKVNCSYLLARSRRSLSNDGASGSGIWVCAVSLSGASRECYDRL